MLVSPIATQSKPKVMIKRIVKALSGATFPPSGGESMVSIFVWWGDACILGLAWARYRNADGVSFTHCCAKQVPCDYQACVCLSYYPVAW